MAFLAAFGTGLPTAVYAAGFHTAEGHISFYKHTTSSDDVYTSSPSPAAITFMETNWTRLMTYPGYWNIGNKLSWYPNAWGYLDSYALYSDPSNTLYASLIGQHPDWVLRDSSGNPLYINYACSAGTCTQYAANITNPAGFRAWWISYAQLFFSQTPPYKGLWIDDVNLDLSRVSNGSGTPVAPIDPNTHAPMTNAAWRGYFADFMVQVRAALPGVEIIHNSLWALGTSDPNIQREIQAADWINLERGVNDAGITGGTGMWSLNQFLAFVDGVHALGTNVIFDGEAPLSDSNTAREYSVACYLLVSNGGDLVGDTSQTPTYWWSGFNADLGVAVAARYTWNGLLRRDFAGGLALVNPPGSSPVTVTLPGSFRRVDGSLVTSITLGATEGAVLSAFSTSSSPAPTQSQWSTLGGSINGKAAVVVNTDGRLEAFVRGGDGALWHRWQNTPGGTWSSWTSLGGLIASNPAVVANVDGRLEAFAIAHDGKLWHTWQMSPAGSWAPWVPLGGSALTDPAAIVNANGCVEVFARSLNGGLSHIYQYFPGGNWSRWASMGGNLIGRPAVAQNADGRLEVFAQGADNALWHISEVSTRGSWSKWGSLGGVLTSPPTVIANKDGRLEAFVIGTDHALWHTWQTSPGGAWSLWNTLGGTLNTNPSASVNLDGRVEVFSRGSDGGLWHIAQSTAGLTWAAWSSLGGSPADEASIARDQSGDLNTFVRGLDTSLSTIAQVVPGTW